MNNELQITLDAVDNASEVIADVAANVADSMGDLATSVSGSAASAESSYADLTSAMSVNSDEISDSAIAVGVSFDAAMTEISSSSSATASTVDSSTSNMRSGFLQLGIAAGAVFAPLAALVSSAVSSAQAWNETSAVVSQTLKDTGSSIPITAIQNYAQQLQSVTLFTQQDALQSEELILSHKDLQGSFQELTMLAADAATKMGLDLPSATKILTNALSDPAAGISQLIRQLNIDLPASTVTTIENLAKFGDTAQADQMIMQALSGQLTGLAQAAAAAAGGGLVLLEQQLGTLATDIGNTFLPELDKLAREITPFVVELEAWVNEHPKLTAGILLTVTALTGLVVAISALGVLVITAGVGLTALGATFTAIGPEVLAVAAVVTFLGAVVHNNWATIVTDTKNMGTEFTKVLDDMESVSAAVWSSIYSVFKGGVNLIIGAINALIGALDAIHVNIPSVKIGSLSTPALDIGFSIPQIPMLAEGGVVTSTTLAILGEAGPEAVMPLSSLGSIANTTGLGGSSAVNGSGNIIINLAGANITNSQTAMMYANQIAKAIQAQLKLKNYN